jgi:hypothetical protein
MRDREIVLMRDRERKRGKERQRQRRFVRERERGRESVFCFFFGKEKQKRNTSIYHTLILPSLYTLLVGAKGGRRGRGGAKLGQK